MSVRENKELYKLLQEEISELIGDVNDKLCRQLQSNVKYISETGLTVRLNLFDLQHKLAKCFSPDIPDPPFPKITDAEVNACFAFGCQNAALRLKRNLEALERACTLEKDLVEFSKVIQGTSLSQYPIHIKLPAEEGQKPRVIALCPPIKPDNTL